MADSRSMFRTWWRDRVDYRWLVETFESHSALGRFKFMLGSGGIVMLLIAVLAMIAQADVAGRMGIVQGCTEAVVAGVWAVRWWFFAWPREAESLIWIALFDLDAAANTFLVHDRVIGVLGIVLLVAMGGYVAVFHSPRVLALHIAWSVLATVLLAVQMFNGPHRADLAIGLAVVLVMVVVAGVILPFLQFSHWILRVDALSDPLTTLLNRRGLDSYLSTYIGRRQRTTAYVATLDLDRFKTVNDTYGHPFGDEVLVRAARCIRAAVDPDALVARTGGEEFVVVGYLHTDPATIGERLRHAIATMPGLPLTITASVGVAILDTAQPELPYHEATYRSLLRGSDSAMYRAKRLGGNTVVIANEDQPTPAPHSRNDLAAQHPAP